MAPSPYEMGVELVDAILHLVPVVEKLQHVEEVAELRGLFPHVHLVG